VTDTEAPTAPSATELRAWLTGRVAYYAELDRAGIDAGAPLASYGIDSVYALAICGDIEDEFHLAIEPTLIWERDTIDSLIDYLAGKPEEPS
jgi:acyl carrier protein